VVRAHLKTMARLNIDYQLLTWEGDILRLQVLGARVRSAEADRSGSIFKTRASTPAAG
jgi:hypothetical protein